MFDDLRMTCALLNMPFKALILSEMHKLITLRMLNFSNKESALSLLLQEENFNARKSYFRPIEVLEIEFFSRLDDSQLHLYICDT